MKASGKKAAAILEAGGLFFAVVILFKVVQATPMYAWELANLPGRVIEYACAIVLTVGWLLLSRRDLRQYGFAFPQPRAQARLAAAAFFPFLLISLTLHFLGWDTWGGAVGVSLVILAVLAFLAWLARRKGWQTSLLVGLVPLLAAGSLQTVQTNYLARLVYSLLFAALGEEILFRGFILTRLNLAFAQPFSVLGVQFGLGSLLAAGFFSLWHILIPFNPLLGQGQLAWQWGLWTFCFGLLLNFVREKSGGIVVPVGLHYLVNF